MPLLLPAGAPGAAPFPGGKPFRPLPPQANGGCFGGLTHANGGCFGGQPALIMAGGQPKLLPAGFGVPTVLPAPAKREPAADTSAPPAPMGNGEGGAPGGGVGGSPGAAAPAASHAASAMTMPPQRWALQPAATAMPPNGSALSTHRPPIVLPASGATNVVGSLAGPGGSFALILPSGGGSGSPASARAADGGVALNADGAVVVVEDAEDGRGAEVAVAVAVAPTQPPAAADAAPNAVGSYAPRDASAAGDATTPAEASAEVVVAAEAAVVAVPEESKPARQRLLELQSLLEEGLVRQDEYEAKREKILNGI